MYTQVKLISSHFQKPNYELLSLTVSGTLLNAQIN